jgi:prepilin signal peptidase PulO-like enzyme (type II secretory pathway)
VQIAIDVEYYMASDFVDFIMFLAVIVISFVDGKTVYDGLLFMCVGATFMLVCRQIVMWRIGQDPLGMGDIKIVAVMAPLANSGLNLLLTTGLFGVLGIFFGIAWRKHTKSEMFPFAPPIMIAFLVNYLFFAKYFY